jgi:hypothetical protein
MKKTIAIVAVILVVMLAVLVPSLAFPASLLPGGPLATLNPHPPAITAIPKISPGFLLIVDIPDANLRAALHDKTSIPDSDPIHSSDLAALTGTLDLSSKHIVNLDGLQYCTGISRVKLRDNDIETLPDKFYTMHNLWEIDLASNKLTELSSAISGITNLQTLDVSGNKLQALPDELCTMPNFSQLRASGNDLYNLPSHIGDGKISELTVYDNRIGSLPASLGSSTHLNTLDIRFNRLTKLPSALDDHSWFEINVEWNFIDMASGSSQRAFMDGLPADSKVYLHQLKPVSGIAAEASSDTITLTWQPGQNGEDGASKWTVKSYVVYKLEGGSLVKLGDLDASTLQYKHTGLTPSTQYTYRIGVDYQVVVPGHSVTLRGYTEAKISTLAPSAATAAVSAEATTVQESSPPSGVAESMPAASYDVAESLPPASHADSASADAQAAEGGLPVWLIVVICVVAAAIVGVAVVLSVVLLKKKKAA